MIKKYNFPTLPPYDEAQKEDRMVHMVNQAVGQAFINHASIMANSVHNVVFKTLQERGSLGFMGPAYQQVRWFSPLPGRLLQHLRLTLKLRQKGVLEHTADWYYNIVSVCSCVYKFYTNGYTCKGRIHDRVPGWMGSCYWLWYPSRVLDVICSRAVKHIGFTADESIS